MQEPLVHLVGAGPGDPGLVTLRAVELLARADVVLYDYLVNPAVLGHAPSAAQRICLGDAEGGRRYAQEEINRLLGEHARAGRRVVRLKGGDPFVFGRGGEEAEALEAAGIAWEAVPGVTAALAAGAYAGIPLTHRDRASAVTFVTGHEDPGKPGGALDWSALARVPGTLVVYMGLAKIEAIVAALVGAGKPADTPAAVVCRASLPSQRTVTGTLADIAARAASASIGPPAVILVGSVVELRDRLAWFERRPLFGKRIVATRPREQAGELIARLNALGAEALVLPAVRIEPPEEWQAVDRVLDELDEFDWLVFTSANGVRFFLERLLHAAASSPPYEASGKGVFAPPRRAGRDLRILGRLKLAAIGPGTAAALAAYHLCADVVPDEFRAEHLAAALARQVRGKRVLWPHADRVRDVLRRELTAAEADLVEVVVYRNLDVHDPDPAVLDELRAGRVDWVTLTSSAIARSFAAMFDEHTKIQIGRTVKLASISPVTTQAVRELGWEAAAEASEYTIDGLVDAIVASDHPSSPERT